MRDLMGELRALKNTKEDKECRPRGDGTLRRRRSAVGNTWAGCGSIPVVFLLRLQVTRVSSYVRRLFPSKETRLEGAGR